MRYLYQDFVILVYSWDLSRIQECEKGNAECIDSESHTKITYNGVILCWDTQSWPPIMAVSVVDIVSLSRSTLSSMVVPGL